MLLRKIHYIILLLGTIYSYGGNVKEFHLTLNRNDFSYNTDGEYLYISSNKYLCEYGGNTNEPALPFVGINILVGENDSLMNFSFSTKEQEIMNDVTIINNSVEISTNVMQDNSSISTGINYMGDSYPMPLVRYAGSHNANGYKFVSFLISPFRYNNINRTLYFENNISISLETEEKLHKTNDNYYCNRISTDRIRELVINGEDVPLLYPSERNALNQLNRSVTQYDYIIITNNSLKNTFLRLADWKTRKGIRTKVLTTEEIYSTYSGASNQQKIKYALKYYYENCPNLKYALLAGDVNIVPTQMCVVKYIPNNNTYHESNCPVDLYYANFNTMNWDNNGNGIYGEPNDVSSPYPQIAITRAPVSSISDAEIFVNRIIDYETNPKIGNWSNNILMCGNILKSYYNVNGIMMSDTHYKGEKFYSDYIAPYWNGNNVSFYDTGTDFSGGASYDFNPHNIQKQLSKGYTFVNLVTHGNPTSFVTESTTYTTGYADTLTNSNHSIIITTACYTNAFDSISKCLSEAFIRNQQSGIISYFGCSRLGWYNKLQQYYGTSEKINSVLYNILFNSNEKCFGEIVRQTKENIIYHCSGYSTPYRWLLFGLNPIGDPEMPIFTSTPQKFTNVTISYTNGTLIVNTGVSDCRISVVSAYDMGDSYYDIRNGMSATFSNLTGEYSLCITKSGYIPYIAKCGSTVYIQNESINGDYQVFSNQTFAGNNVTTNKPYGPVEINSGKTTIEGTNGVTINNNFEVKTGASLEIKTN